MPKIVFAKVAAVGFVICIWGWCTIGAHRKSKRAAVELVYVDAYVAELFCMLYPYIREKLANDEIEFLFWRSFDSSLLDNA